MLRLVITWPISSSRSASVLVSDGGLGQKELMVAPWP